MVDQSAEILRSAVAWALYLADEQEDTLAAALLAQVLDRHHDISASDQRPETTIASAKATTINVFRTSSCTLM
jgi:hypothetical protein